MDIKSNLNQQIKRGHISVAYFDGSSESAQSTKIDKYLSKRLSQIKYWLIKQLRVHNDRASALRVCQCDRLDKH
jgi:uncharacterized protein YicC (UPF0701 family)